MKTFDIEGKLSMISADASSIQILTGEVGEGLEQNCSDYFKLHAAYELAENQIRLADEVEDWLVEIRDKLQ